MNDSNIGFIFQAAGFILIVLFCCYELFFSFKHPDMTEVRVFLCIVANDCEAKK